MKKMTRQEIVARNLKLLKEAIDAGEKVQPNHRFEYKGVRLGSFLVDVKRRNREELIKKIEKLGFSYDKHSSDPEVFLKRYIKALMESDPSEKGKFITKFNLRILPKKSKLKKKSIKELNIVWRLKYNEKRKWTKPLSTKDRVDKWKKYRYDKVHNPEGKWYGTLTKIKDLYYWVRANRKNQRMHLLRKFFTEKEIDELRKEGFR